MVHRKEAAAMVDARGQLKGFGGPELDLLGFWKRLSRNNVTHD
jgi:hypothetical protein